MCVAAGEGFLFRAEVADDLHHSLCAGHRVGKSEVRACVVIARDEMQTVESDCRAVALVDFGNLDLRADVGVLADGDGLVKLCGNRVEIAFCACGVRGFQHLAVFVVDACLRGCRAEDLALFDVARAPGDGEGILRGHLRGAVEDADAGIVRDLNLGLANLYVIRVGGGGMDGRDIGISADLDMCRARIFAENLAREGDI